MPYEAFTSDIIYILIDKMSVNIIKSFNDSMKKDFNKIVERENTVNHLFFLFFPMMFSILCKFSIRHLQRLSIWTIL